MLIKPGKVLDILRNHNGFVRGDTLTRELHGIPSDAPLSDVLLYETLEATSAVADAMVHTQPDIGFTMVPNRGKSRFGLDDKSFPKLLMPDDPRPKARTGRKKTVKLNPDGTPVEEKEVQAWVPGVHIVDSKYWEAEADAAVNTAKMQDTFTAAGLICTVKQARPGVVDSVNGFFVNVWVPTLA